MVKKIRTLFKKTNKDENELFINAIVQVVRDNPNDSELGQVMRQFYHNLEYLKEFSEVDSYKLLMSINKKKTYKP